MGWLIFLAGVATGVVATGVWFVRGVLKEFKLW